MIGFKVPKSNICVDYWGDEKKPHIRFLTHIHDNRIQNISKVKDKIYMSSFSLWYLREIIKETPKDVSCLLLNKRHKIRASNEQDQDKKFFHVTLLDAHHCPGSVMYFFEGDFGQVLCTGDFRFTTSMLENPTLNSLIESKSLDILNVDNRYIGEHCNFPSREDTIRDAVEMLKSYPDHKIIICIGKWGKFELLKAIADELKEKISVSPTCMMIGKKLGMSNIFTLQKCRISTHETDLLSLKDLDEVKSKLGPTITLIMGALYSTCVKYGKRNMNEYRKLGLHLIPYSDHSNHQELYEFIDAIRPNFIVPIVKSGPGARHNPDIVKNYTIPESVALLQRSYTLGQHQGSARVEENSEPIIYDLLDNMHSRGTNDGRERKRLPSSDDPSVNECSTAKRKKVGDCDQKNDHNKQMNDSLNKRISNYWTSQGIKGQTFRDPELQGVYEYL